jgi:hypothetical protein
MGLLRDGLDDLRWALSRRLHTLGYLLFVLPLAFLGAAASVDA